MDRQPKTRSQQALYKIQAPWSGRAAILALSLGLLFPVALAGQNAAANLANSAGSQSNPNQVSFEASPAPAPSQRNRGYSLPENECSADYWNPYLGKDNAVTQSTARVQQSSLEEIDAADTIEELPSEIVGEAESVHQLQGEVVQPQPGVQQLDSELVRPEPSLGDMHPAMPSVDTPWDHPDSGTVPVP